MDFVLQNPATTIEVLMIALGGAAYLSREKAMQVFGVLAFLGANFAILAQVIGRLVEGSAITPVDIVTVICVFGILYAGTKFRSRTRESRVDDEGFPISQDFGDA